MTVITDTAAPRSANTWTMGIAVGVLLLLLVAYLPTLQFDYAVRDQWRAFALPESSTRLTEMAVCSSDALPFYVRSGRPLVWIGECVERALVSDIREFRYLRVVAIIVLLATWWHLATVLAKTIGFETALFTAAAFVLSPGVIFMTELGMNGVPVLCAVSATVGSIAQLNGSSVNTRCGDRVRRRVRAFALFILACFLYPAWAFTVVPLIAMQSGLTETCSITDKLRRGGRLLWFYACAVVAYFVLVKLMVAVNLFGSAHTNMGDGRYEVSPTLSPTVVAARLMRALSYVSEGYLWDLPLKAVLMTAGIVAFGMLTWHRISTRHTHSTVGRIVIVVLLLFAGFASVAASMLPWILSGMQEMNERFFLPAYLLPVASVFAAASAVVRRFRPDGQGWPAIGLCICLMLAFAVNRITNLDATASIVRTDFLRQRVNEWLDRQGYETEPLLLLIPPYGNNSEPRPSFIRRLLAHPDRTDTGKWSGDPNHYYYVVSAILRERHDHPLGRSIGFINCGTNRVCTERNLEQGEAVFALLSEAEAVQGYASVPRPYLLVNVSELTAHPVQPVVTVIRSERQ